MEVALEEKICKCLYWNLRKKWWKMSVVVTSFSNDDRACHPALLKAVPTIDILIDQVHKFQNSYFKEHPHLRNAAAVLQKAYCLRRVISEHAMRYVRTYIESHGNTESIDLLLQFPKFGLVCFTQAYAQGAKWKKLLIHWNENQE